MPRSSSFNKCLLANTGSKVQILYITLYVYVCMHEICLFVHACDVCVDYRMSIEGLRSPQHRSITKAENLVRCSWPEKIVRRLQVNRALSASEVNGMRKYKVQNH